MQFSPSFRHFSLRSKYSPKHPVLTHPHVTSGTVGPALTTNKWINYRSVFVR